MFIKAKIYQLNLKYDFKNDDLDDSVDRSYQKMAEIIQYLSDMSITLNLHFFNKMFDSLLFQPVQPLS